MARFGRPTTRVSLTGNERETLQRWARRPSSAQVLALRSRIVLASAEGRTDTDVATELKVHPVTVSKWRHRFAAERLEGLADPGRARPAQSAPTSSRLSWSTRWSPPHPMPPTGPPGPWPKNTASTTTRWPRFGRPSGSNRGGRRASRCPPTRTWWRSSGTWWGCTWAAGGGGRVRGRRKGPRSKP
jgi:hypothetical protein